MQKNDVVKEVKAKEQPSRLLFEAASKGELERSRELLVKYANANYQEVGRFEKWWWLMKSVMTHRIVKQRHRGTLRSPIHQAAELGYIDICKVLCEEAQANISLKDKVSLLCENMQYTSTEFGITGFQ